MCNTRKLDAIALAYCEAVFPPNPQKNKTNPLETIPNDRQFQSFNRSDS
jgi:hypothetical protein